MVYQELCLASKEFARRFECQISSRYRNYGTLIVLFFAATAVAFAGGPLNGTYTVGGTSPDYPTIGAAINDLHTEGVAGPVIMNIRDGVYEEMFTIGQISGTSNANHVTFQSESGSNTNVTLQFKSDGTQPLWMLDTVSYLTFHDLTFRNDSTAAYDLFEMQGNASDVAFLNCHFESAAGDNDYALYLYPDTAWNIRVEGCSFDTMYLPIYIYGYDSVYGVHVMNNSFTYTEDYPIEVERGVDVEIIGNELSGYFDDPIYLYECRNVTLRHNSGYWGNNGLIEVNYSEYVTIDSNWIDSSDYEAFYIYECDFITVTNNYVDYTYYSGVYIEYVDSGGYVIVENNTIDGYTDDYGIYIYDVEYNEVEVRNNSFNGWQDEYAIYIYDVNNSTVYIEENEASDYIAYYGVYFDGVESDVWIRSNVFSGYVDEYGIYVDEARNMWVTDNFVDSANYWGIYCEDLAGFGVISDNELNWANDGGIYCSYANGVLIENNELNEPGDYAIEADHNDSSLLIKNNFITSITANENMTGIYVWDSEIGGGDFEVIGNKILTAGEYEAMYIARVICDPANRGLVANNVATGFAYGYDSYLNHNIDVLNNSFTLFGPNVYNALYLDHDTGLVMMNNIFSYDNDDTTQTFLYDNTSVYTLDYNVYHISEKIAFSKTDSLFADHVANSGQDGNSLTVDPMFYNDTTDLHVCNGGDLYQSGAAITAPTHDPDSIARDLAMPTIGAYELQQGDGAPLAGFDFTASALDLSFDNTTLNYAEFHWDFGDAAGMSTDANPSYTYATAGTYVVTLTAENECGSSVFKDTIEVTFPVGIEAVSPATGIRLYPNPTEGMFSIEITTDKLSEVEITIVNAQGIQIHSESLVVVDRMVRQVDLIDLSTGFYFVNIHYDGRKITQKLLKY